MTTTLQSKPISTTLDDERVLPESAELGTFAHHFARYQFALAQMRGQERVLDAGCGTGYGTHLLSGKGSLAVGIDYSPLAIDYARGRFVRSNLAFRVMDCSRLDFPDQSFDLAVSFEVFEHMTDAELFLQELSRVLTPGGRLIISTPNRITSDLHMRKEGLNNEFHVNMVNASEFRSVLSSHFSSIQIFGQRLRGNPIYSLFRSLDVLNLRIRLMRARTRRRAQKAFGIPEPYATQASDWIFSPRQLRQANTLVAVCRRAGSH